MSSSGRALGGRRLDSGDKREMLLDIAEAVFCRLGHAGTTIAELAAAAGVTRPTVYAYFPSKDEVFRALADRVRGEFLALQERVDTASPERTAREALAAYLDAYTRHQGILRVIAHQSLSDPAVRALREEIFARAERRNTRFLQRLAEQGIARPVVAPAVLSTAVTGIVARFAELAAAEPARQERLAEELSAIYLRLAGIGRAGEHRG